VSEVGRLGAERSSAQLVGVTEEAEGLAAAAGAMAARERALLSALTLERELSAKRCAMDAAAAAGPGAFARCQALGGAVSELSAALDAARGEHTRLAERNAAELGAWKTCFQREMLACARGLCMVQVRRVRACMHACTQCTPHTKHAGMPCSDQQGCIRSRTCYYGWLRPASSSFVGV
jgi:hypothetical protein